MAGLPPLFFFTDEQRTPEPLRHIAKLPEGCGVVFRHYGVAGRAHLTRNITAACRAQDRLLLIAGEPALAREVGADGIHLPAALLRTLTDLPPARLITAAVHNAEEIWQAETLGVDAVFLSPVFPTASHPIAAGLGVELFTTLVASTRLPVYALGGITDETALALAHSGAAGLAAIDGLI